MLNIYDETRPSRVTVAFEDKALSFMLSKDATFEDLADRLDRLGEPYHGKPIAIEVKFAAAFDAQRRRLVSGLGRGRGIGTAAPKGTPNANLGPGLTPDHKCRYRGRREIQSAKPQPRQQASETVKVLTRLQKSRTIGQDGSIIACIRSAPLDGAL
jgi:hypothetical protein